MRFIKAKNILFIAMVVAVSPSYFFCLDLRASGGGGEAPPAAAAGPTMSKDKKEFNEKTAKLTSLGNKIAEGEKKFAELVRKKAASKNSEEKQLIIKDLLEISKQRNLDAQNFNKVKSELSLRYPSQGEVLNRRYRTQDQKTLEDLEGSVGMEEKLTRLKVRIGQKYAPLLEETGSGSKSPTAAVQTIPEPDKPKRLRLEK